jgi:Gas vesicle synthesis protein GvpL/GvpF
LLARVDGCVELAVRVALPAAERRPRSGHDYIAAKIDARRSFDQVLAPLESLAADARRGGAGAEPVLTASYLVARDDVQRFADELRDVQERHPQLAVSCTGPWAPYSFVGEDPS